MMDIRQVDQGFAVAPQLQPEDMALLAKAGFTTVMCNRPDGEEPGQPPLDALREAAEAAGLAFHHVPVSGGAFPESAIAEFRRIRHEARGPVMAYCRSGTRSVTLDALANPDELSVEDRLARAAAAGYDLSAIEGRLRS
jgi:sulfide:quinone oxidoreductase